LIAFLLSALMAVGAAAGSDSEKEPGEVKSGREGVAEVEKQYKVLKDPALQERLDRIGKPIAEVANTVVVPASYGDSKIIKFEYTFKILDEKDINAFALPGGFIYVNKGLLDFVESDHELASVLAHEVVHAAHHHMVALVKQQTKLNNKMALVLLAALLGKMPSADVGNIMFGATLVQIAKMSSYGQEAEADADRAAVVYLSKTEYNPVGLLTFIERLSRTTEIYEEKAGIWQTHPFGGDRRATILAKLKELKIPIARRQVSNTLKAMVATKSVDGRDVVEITIGEKVVMRVADGADGEPAAKRAERLARDLNNMLDSEAQYREIKLDGSEPMVTVRGVPLLRVSESDAQLSQSTPAEVAKRAAETIRAAAWKQMVDMLMAPMGSNLK